MFRDALTDVGFITLRNAIPLEKLPHFRDAFVLPAIDLYARMRRLSPGVARAPNGGVPHDSPTLETAAISLADVAGHLEYEPGTDHLFNAARFDRESLVEPEECFAVHNLAVGDVLVITNWTPYLFRYDDAQLAAQSRD
jgi:hypothetical protein